MGVSLNKRNIYIKEYDFRNRMKKIIPNMYYLTHNIHTYTAKLIPQIPRYFIEKYTLKEDVVLDPFCGSGTTLLEAKLLSREAIGIDINPLATLISEVKTASLDMDQLILAIHLVKKDVKNNNGRIVVTFPNIEYWFCEKAQDELFKIKFGIGHVKGRFSESIYKFLLVCFSSIIRKSSYADPRIAKIFKSKRVKEKIEAGWIPKPTQYFEDALDKNFERIKSLSDNLNGNNNYVKVFQGNARETSTILNQHRIKKVDFIITSPPYINAQDYFRSYKLELWWLGLATPEEVRKLNMHAIGTERISGYNYNILPKSDYHHLNKILNKIWKIDKKKSYIVYDYFENMKQVLNQFYKVLKNRKHFCLITGCNTICGVYTPLCQDDTGHFSTLI